MFRVLRHYLPLRKGLLVFSETVLLTLVLAAGMTLHLHEPSPRVIGNLAQQGLSLEAATWRCLASAFLTAVLSQLAISFNELYDFRISNSRYDRSARFVTSAGSAIAVALGALTLARLWRFDRVLDYPGLSFSGQVQTLVFTLLVGFAILWFWRHAFHFALHRTTFHERVLVLGAGDAARSIAAEIESRPDAGFEAVGLLPEEALPSSDDEPPRRSAEPACTPIVSRAARSGGEVSVEPMVTSSGGVAVLQPARLTREKTAEAAPSGDGSSSNGNGHDKEARESLFELVQRLHVDMVVVALADRRGNLPTEELLQCRLAGIAVMEREALYEHITGKIAVEALRPSYLIFNEGFGRTPWTELGKRSLDLTLSVIGLLLTWPLMLATAIAVRLDSAGPILYRQERVGRDGKSFTLMKFRSMRVDAETETGPVWATSDDPRITRTGRMLRRTRLDELPQLFNVLMGNMSLVGPRPERPVFVEDLARKIPYYPQRHIVQPGLTGWAQINYPYGNTVQDSLQKLQYDLFYIKNHSLLFDLSILFNTIKTVLLRKGT